MCSIHWLLWYQETLSVGGYGFLALQNSRLLSCTNVQIIKAGYYVLF